MQPSHFGKAAMLGGPMRTYFIPTNFKDPGYIFNGMIAVRNAIDGIVFAFLGLIIASLLPFNKDGAISGYILIIGLFAMIGFAGIQGIPVSVYLSNAIRWQSRKKPYLYNHHGTSFSMTAAEVMLSEPQLRNKLADALDKMKESMASRKVEYIEGETFQFAEDPELETLRFADEQLHEETEPIQKEVPDIQQKPATEEVNFDFIHDSIVLRDIEEGDRK